MSGSAPPAKAVVLAKYFLEKMFIFIILSSISIVLVEFFIGLLCGRRDTGTSPFVGTFAVSKISVGGIVTVTGRLFGKCCGVAISADSASVFPGFAGPLSGDLGDLRYGGRRLV